MSELRLSKNVTAQFSSFQEMGEVLLKQKSKKNNSRPNENWVQHINKMKDRILGKCGTCGETLSFISGTNACACKNPECKGRKITRKDGTVFYIPVTKTLKPRDTEYANKNFC